MPIVYRVTGPNETQLALRRGLRPQPIPRATKFATGVRRGIHFFTTLDEAREVAQSISEDVPSTTFTVITLDLPTLATSVPDLNWNIPPEDPVTAIVYPQSVPAEDIQIVTSYKDGEEI